MPVFKASKSFPPLSHTGFLNFGTVDIGQNEPALSYALPDSCQYSQHLLLHASHTPCTPCQISSREGKYLPSWDHWLKSSAWGGSFQEKETKLSECFEILLFFHGLFWDLSLEGEHSSLNWSSSRQKIWLCFEHCLPVNRWNFYRGCWQLFEIWEPVFWLVWPTLGSLGMVSHPHTTAWGWWRLLS